MSPDRLLARAEAHHVRGPVAWPGHVLVRLGGLQFEPGEPVPGQPGGRRLEVPAASIVDARHNAREGLLVVETPQRRLRFTGHDLDSVHAALLALRDDHTVQAGALRATGEDAEGHAAALRRGPILHPGGVTLDAEGLRYTPTGLLDAMVGVRAIAIPWSHVHRVVPHGSPNGLLEIQHLGGDLVLQPAAPVRLHAAVLARLHAAQAAEQADPGARAAALDALRSRWPDADADAARYAALALHIDGGGTARVGALLVDDRSLRFLPRVGAGAPLTLDVGTLVRRGASGRGPLPALRLGHGDQRHGFVPADGTTGLSALWDVIQAPSRLVPWADTGPRTRQRVTGPSRFVTLHVGAAVTPVIPLRSYESGAAWHLVVEGAAPAIPTGTTLRVEVGQPEGVYVLDAVLLEALERPEAEGGRAEATLLLQPGPTLQVHNQRQGFRADVRLAASARALQVDAGLAAHERVALRVVDLSIGGCRVRSEAELPVGVVLDVAIELPERTIRAHARVLRGGAPTDDETWHYGLRFERLSAVDEDRIHRLVLARQRDRISVPPSDEPSLTTEAFR